MGQPPGGKYVNVPGLLCREAVVRNCDGAGRGLVAAGWDRGSRKGSSALRLVAKAKDLCVEARAGRRRCGDAYIKCVGRMSEARSAVSTPDPPEDPTPQSTSSARSPCTANATSSGAQSDGYIPRAAQWRNDENGQSAACAARPCFTGLKCV